MTSSFAKQIAMIEYGLKDPSFLYVGDLSSERDWTDEWMMHDSLDWWCQRLAGQHVR